MASAKKKLDEYHLKILRQLVTMPANKECFDCHQRGPTYVNVTIGSFVCTTCSGMLRGLTPPHRVKSISMATFTPEEVDFVKARGNEYCRRVWLGLLDSQLPPTKDEQQIKDSMIAKYERKRYYLDPADASTLEKPVNGPLPTQRKPSTPSEAVKVTSVSSATTNATPSLQPPNSLAFKPPTNQTKNTNLFTPEPFADFNNLSIPPPCDPFNNSQSAVAPTSSQPSFANFDNNPVFSSSSTGMPGSGVGEAATVPAEDRYAALKDLDCLMKSQQQQQQQQQAVEPAAEWTAANGGLTNGVTNGWAAPSLFPNGVNVNTNHASDNSATINPFKGETAWNNGFSGGANPFRNSRPFSSDNGWSNAPNGQVTNGFTTSQSLYFPSAKVPWSNDSVSNPFVVGSSPQGSTLHSSNPFL